MAQWSGQYSGKTHLSKVRDLEQQLRHAIEVILNLDSEVNSESQKQTVVRLAKRLLDARVRATKARAAALDPRNEDDRKKAESKIQTMLNGGFEKILDEFGASFLH